MFQKITDNKWLNLFKTDKPNGGDYFFASRKKNPDIEKNEDAVVIAAYKRTEDGLRLIVTKEFRPALNGYEWGFPAGLIDGDEGLYGAAKRELKEETGLDAVKLLYVSPQIYSSAGLTDESVAMVFVEATGELNTEGNETDEVIIVYEMTPDEVSHLVCSGKKIGAKAWAVMDRFAQNGKLWMEK